MGREISLADVLAGLEERERIVITQRLQGHTFAEIAPLAGCKSRQRVQQLEFAAVLVEQGFVDDLHDVLSYRCSADPLHQHPCGLRACRTGC